jgi:hypothetical protein
VKSVIKLAESEKDAELFEQVKLSQYVSNEKSVLKMKKIARRDSCH